MGNNQSRLSEMYSTLISGEFKQYDDVKKLNKICGVYIIYNEKNEIIYIGSTKNFRTRFGTDLRHHTTHTIIRKLKKLFESDLLFDSFKYVSEMCKFRILECESKREAEAIEHFAIWDLDPVLNKK